MLLSLSKIQPGEYRVDDTYLTIVHSRRRPRGQDNSGWMILPVTADHPWLDRNQNLFTTCFPRLRDACEYLIAILEVDPTPPALQPASSSPPATIRRKRTGRHVVIARLPDGQTLRGTLMRAHGYWMLVDREGACLRKYSTLRQAARYAGAAMVNCSHRDWS